MEYRKYKDSQLLEWEKIYTSYNEVKDRKDLPDWFKEYLHHIEEKYKSLNRIFTLKGMSETNEDYYYYGIDENGKEFFDTCVNNIVKVE